MALTRLHVAAISALAMNALLLAGCSRTESPQATATAAPLPDDNQLRERLDKVLDFTYANRHLDTKDQAAWQIVHGALCFGRDFKVYKDGQLVGALDYLLGGGELRGWTMRKGDHGVVAVLDPGSKTGQGHPDQWLGYLSQAGLQPDDPIVVGGQTYKIRDLITQAQWDIYDGMEATWTLMAFGTILPLDAQWKSKDGSDWTIDRIVKMESGQDLGASACGGTHRMFALATALNKRKASGEKLSDDPQDAWRLAEKKVQDCVDSARKFQQPDGSLSTSYFARPSASAEIDTRISTTGHAFEFLMVALDDEQIKEPWVTRAAAHLIGCFEKTEKFDLECGALYHAAHGLELYRARRFGPRKRATDSESPPASSAPSATPVDAPAASTPSPVESPAPAQTSAQAGQ